MLRRSYLLFSVIALLIAIVIPTSAQMQPTTVRVEIADTKAPIEGATVDLYRTDMGGKFTGTTDKNGTVTFAGTTQAAAYIVVASAPKFAPNFISSAKTAQSGIVLSLSAGDGRKPTEADVRSAIKTLETGEGGNLTAEEREKIKKQNAERAAIEAKNTKARSDSETAQRLISEGTDAHEAKNYSLAIAKFDEGIAAVPDFVGITPRFLINRGVTFNERAATEYNRTVVAKDMPATEKVAVYAKIEKDFADAAASYLKAWEMVKDPAANPTYAKTMEGYRNEVIAKSFITFRTAAQIRRVGVPVIIPAKAIIAGYVQQQSDNAKKAEALAVLADVLRLGGDYEGSITEYRNALAISPENPEALFGAAVALIMSGTKYDDKGTESKDKVKYQEAANYLAKFEPIAKGNPKYAEIASEVPGLVEVLKAADVVPQKTKTTPAKRKT